MRIGTRSSPLALRQAQIVKNLLIHEQLFAPDEIEIIPFKTTGDIITNQNLDEFGGKGLFTKEIEEALIDNKIDIAVHSMKDVATILPAQLAIPCTLPREDVRDAFISHIAKDIASLPKGAKFGTCSLRRASQVLHLRPDLEIVMFRGNIDTRLRKLEEGLADATLLACAGLIRNNQHSYITSILNTDEMLPAVAQGALGVQCRVADKVTYSMLEYLNHKETFECVNVERTFLRALDGSCRTPIAGLATLDGDNIHFEGLVASRDGSICKRERFVCGLINAQDMAWELGKQMREILKDKS